MKSIVVLPLLAGVFFMPVTIATPVVAEVSMDSGDFANSSNGDGDSSGVTIAENEGEGVELAPNEDETACEGESVGASRC